MCKNIFENKYNKRIEAKVLVTWSRHQIDNLLQVGTECVVFVSRASVIQRLEHGPSQGGHQLSEFLNKLNSIRRAHDEKKKDKH